MPPKRARSSETPVPTTEGGVPDGSALPDAQWKAMQDILNHIYDYRLPDEHDPSKVFHRKVNKRILPAYYEVIKEPMALSTIKAKINTRQYTSFEAFVRDFALIPHNAQVYNRPDAGAYQDALIIKEQLEQHLQKLVDTNLVTADAIKIPYLGEIPPQDELPPDEDDEEDDDDDEEEDEEEDEAPEPEEGVPVKRKRGRPRLNKGPKREGEADAKTDDADTKRKRGRPPKVNTPTEARIHAVLKAIRKPKNSLGQAKISHFERLPDKTAMPEYFNEIKTPMAFDVLKRKLKRKKYQTLDLFMRDVDLMFENAKQYNTDESQIFKDAVELQVEAHRLADEEKSKPDTDYIMDEGRIPMPNGILHNGELYKVGDWVLVQNANDLTKPIPSQIYRTWQGADGGKWVNVCWYYRPEQTVHRFDKHFLDNEVVKTGQYRDHRIDEIVGRCFIMFFTRYYKGRPRLLPLDMEVFVCEARYNEEKLTFNKIKTWASCLPDEVRDKDYEMRLFDAPRRMKKFPSPISYLMKDDAKETDDMPKPEWGAENAPPKIGAVHKRPRDPRDSLPPLPTPSPPPQPVPAPVAARPPPATAHGPQVTYASMTSTMPQLIAQSPMRPHIASRPSFGSSQPAQFQPPLTSPRPAPQRTISGHSQILPPATPRAMPTPGGSSYPEGGIPTYPSRAPSNPYLPPERPASSYRGPPPIEVYALPSAANASIPLEIRNQFQQDDTGRILFFAAPPIYLADDAEEDKSGKALGHSARYMAEKIRRAEGTRRRRAEYESKKAEHAAEKKKRKLEDEVTQQETMRTLKKRALEALETQLSTAVRQDMKAIYGEEDWSKKMDEQISQLRKVQKEASAQHAAVDGHARLREARLMVPLGASGTLFDDLEV